MRLRSLPPLLRDEPALGLVHGRAHAVLAVPEAARADRFDLFMSVPPPFSSCVACLAIERQAYGRPMRGRRAVHPHSRAARMIPAHPCQLFLAKPPCPPPNTTRSTRFSIDFRTVNLSDLVDRVGAPNLDSECSGTTLRDFVRASDLEPLPDDVVAIYDGQSRVPAGTAS